MTLRERRRAPTPQGQTGKARWASPVGAFELAARQLDQRVGQGKRDHWDRSAAAGALCDAYLADAVCSRKAERGRRWFCIKQRIEGACSGGKRGFVLWPIHRRRSMEISISAVGFPIIAEPVKADAAGRRPMRDKGRGGQTVVHPATVSGKGCAVPYLRGRHTPPGDA